MLPDRRGYNRAESAALGREDIPPVVGPHS